MKRRLITVILFAVLAAATSSTVLYKIISSNTPRTVKAAPMRVFVAAKDLAAGSMIADGDIRQADWSLTGGLPWIGRREDIVGRGLLAAVGKDEPFAESRLAAKGSGAGLASRIPPGMRLVAVHVDELTGLSRFIFPGMHVDVISTGNSGNQNSQGMTARTILQSIEVFSTGQSVERDAKDKQAAVPVFNLLVTPQQAEVLSLAVAQSRIELVLRNPLDKESFVSAVTPAVHLSFNAPVPNLPKNIFKPAVAAKATVSVEPAHQAAPTVEVIHGTKRTVSAVAAATDSESQQ